MEQSVWLCLFHQGVVSALQSRAKMDRERLARLAVRALWPLSVRWLWPQALAHVSLSMCCQQVLEAQVQEHPTQLCVSVRL